jgi:hypothetical protein
MTVMIGIDPHKGSHTAVAVTAAEEPLGKVRVRACPAQAGQLVAWAAAWPERIWAVEGAPGLGRLLDRRAHQRPGRCRPVAQGRRSPRHGDVTGSGQRSSPLLHIPVRESRVESHAA